MFLIGGQALAAQPELRRHEFTEVDMGMPVRMVLHAGNDSVARVAARAAFRRVAELDDTFSDYRPQSDVRRLDARSGEWVIVSAELFELLGRSVAIARLTGGAFDPTVAPVVALWREARRSKILPRASQVDSARALVGWQKIALDSSRRAVRLAPGVRLDFGGIAKGYVLDQARSVLRTFGIESVLIEAGGDIVVGSAPPGKPGWRIDVTGASEQFTRMASSLVNAALSTSGPTMQFVEIEGVRYSHVVDPRSAMALTNGLLVRVIGRDAALVDAISTALSVDSQLATPAGLIVDVRPVDRQSPDDEVPAKPDVLR